MATRVKKAVNQEFLRNLKHLLRSDISFQNWLQRQEELESRLTPAPELPFEASEPVPPKKRRAA